MKKRKKYDNVMDEQIWTTPNQRKLIAAAPELLEALKSLEEYTDKTFRALESAEWVDQDRLYHMTVKNIAEKSLEYARAAIAKATQG